MISSQCLIKTVSAFQLVYIDYRKRCRLAVTYAYPVYLFKKYPLRQLLGCLAVNTEEEPLAGVLPCMMHRISCSRSRFGAMLQDLISRIDASVSWWQLVTHKFHWVSHNLKTSHVWRAPLTILVAGMFLCTQEERSSARCF